MPAVAELLGLQQIGGKARTLAYRWARQGVEVGVLDADANPYTTPPRDLGPVTWTRSRHHVDLALDGLRTQCHVARYDDLWCVDDGLWSTQWRELPRFADLEAEAGARGPSTPVPGTVTLVLVAPGDRVTAGQTLVVLEAMKMEHRITADADGMVAEVLVTAGQSVDAHAVVVVLDMAEGDA